MPYISHFRAHKKLAHYYVPAVYHHVFIVRYFKYQ